MGICEIAAVILEIKLHRITTKQKKRIKLKDILDDYDDFDDAGDVAPQSSLFHDCARNEKRLVLLYTPVSS